MYVMHTSIDLHISDRQKASISFERGIILMLLMEKLSTALGYLVQQVFAQLISPSFPLSPPYPDEENLS